jgi:hypothetical protein
MWFNISNQLVRKCSGFRRSVDLKQFGGVFRCMHVSRSISQAENTYNAEPLETRILRNAMKFVPKSGFTLDSLRQSYFYSIFIF